jgi:Tfp pilus assembly protein FimT
MKGKFNVKTRIKGTEGLTLIELVVVMCILGVMVLISIPNIGRWLPRYRLRGAVRDVASAMQLARLGAIKDNREWAIQFGYKGDASPWTQSTRRLADYTNVSFGDNGYGSWLGGALTGDLSDGVTFANNRVEFSPGGTAGPGGFNGVVGSAYLRNNRGDAACARIRFTATGAIEVVHWDGDSWEP